MVYTFYDYAPSSIFLPPDGQAEYPSIEELKISNIFDQRLHNYSSDFVPFHQVDKKSWTSDKRNEKFACAPTGSILSRQEVLNIRQ